MTALGGRGLGPQQIGQALPAMRLAGLYREIHQ
jgi:hypothetical protein